MLVKFYAACVIAAIANNDYEGEIKNVGDKVIIRTTPTITIRDYVKNQTLTIEHPESDPIELEVDKAKYFYAACDDIDAYQSDIKLLDDWSRDASQQMKIKVDTGFLADVYSDAHDDNKGTTAGAKSGAYNLGTTGAPVVVTKDAILEYIVDCNTVLNEQDVPEEDRWIVIPPWFSGMIKKSDLKDASLTGDATSVMRNGRIGTIDNTTLYLSNLLTAVADETGFTCWHIMAGQRHALSFAAQLTKVSRVQPSASFSEAIKGLNVYGYKCLKPEALADLYARK